MVKSRYLTHMARVAFHLKIRDGKGTEFRKEHEHVPEQLERAYLNSDAGLKTYSVFERNGHVSDSWS